MIDNLWIGVKQKYFGKRVSAKVLRKVQNGIIIELEKGLFAKVPLYELAWNPQEIKRVCEGIKIGDSIEVMIIDVVPRELKAVASIKQTQDEEWEKLRKKYEIGQEVRGSVRALMPSGAFICLSDGMEGFVPLSDIAPFSVKKPEEALFIDDDVICIVTGIDDEKKSLSLSIKEYFKRLAENGGKRYLPSEEDRESPSKDREAIMESVEIDIPGIESEGIWMGKIEGIERILLIEDEKDYRESFSALLITMGYEVDVALNGEDGIEKVRSNDYSVAFIDIYLPDLNGFELMKEILKIKPKLPIVMITGHKEMPSHIIKEDLAIPYAILQKPIEPEEISNTLKNILEGRKASLPDQKEIRIPVMDGVGFSKTLSKVITDSPVGEYRRMVRKIMDSIGASASAIFRMDSITNEIEIIDSIGINRKSYEKSKYQLKYSPIKSVIENGEEIFESHELGEKEARFKYLLSLVGFNSCIGVPIETSKKCNHALFLFHPQKGHFSGNDLLHTEIATQLLGLA